MNILYYYPEKNSAMFQWQRGHFFDELKRHGIEIFSFNPFLFDSWEEANERLLKKVHEEKYDLFLTDVCSSHMLFVDTLKEIKRFGYPTVSFRPDNLVIPFNDEELSPLFDLVWLTASDTQYLYDKWNVKSVVAPYAANPYLFQYKDGAINRQMCFVGTPYGSRMKMINTITQGGIELALFYNKRPKNITIERKGETTMSIYNRGTSRKIREGLRFKEGRKLLYAEAKYRLFVKEHDLAKNNFVFVYPPVPVRELDRVYSEYCLSLASTSTGYTDILKKPLPIINLRNFEIPMSGGIEFCRFNAELAEYFEDGKEIVFYHNDEDLIERADYYLHKASESAIRQMKKAARFRAENEHTWFNRFSKVLGTLGMDM